MIEIFEGDSEGNIYINPMIKIEVNTYPHRWYIVKYDYDGCKYLWAEDLDWHDCDESSLKLFVQRYYYESKEEAEETLERSHP